MVITNIKSSRIPNRVNLVFSDGSYLPFLVDDIVRLSLQKNQAIDSNLLEKITTASLTYLGTDYCLRQISLSAKTEKIITNKLKLYFSRLTQKFNLLASVQTREIVNQIISYLKSKQLLNENDFVTSFITKNKSKSASEIKFLLRQKGIDIQNFSSQIISNDAAAIKMFLIKKKITKETIANFKEKNKLYASLSRRGFQLSDIKAAIDDYLPFK